MDGFGSSLRRTIAFICISLVIAGTGTLPVAFSTGKQRSRARELVVTERAPTRPDATPWFDRARGLVFRGLVPGAGVCRGSWALADDPAMCTHGPDRSPPGAVVMHRRSTAALAASTADDASTSASTPMIPCYGDGTSGRRVQIVYAHAADVPDRYDEVAPLIAQWAARIDDAFAASAAETGGTRHVRWVTDANCNLVVARVQLTSTGDDSFSATMAELGSVGLQQPDRKYLIWGDADVYCGIANLYGDDTPDLTNRSNTRTGYARIDTGCWGGTVEAHELMHNLGGVQLSAPHTTGGGHCTDGYDRMCYSDAPDVTLTYPCPSPDHGRLFDCNHEDYFSTNPPPGSYLATHWNTASSGFLEAVEPSGWATPTPAPTTSPSPTPTPTTTTSPSPSPTTSPSPTPTPTTTPTATATFTGALSRKSGSRSYTISAGAGTLNATLSFSKSSPLTLTIIGPGGSTVVSRTGSSPVTLSALVPDGAYSIVVSGTPRGNVWFRLTVTYASP